MYIVESKTTISHHKDLYDAQRRFDKCKRAILYEDNTIMNVKGYILPVSFLVNDLKSVIRSLDYGNIPEAKTLLQEAIDRINKSNEIVY